MQGAREMLIFFIIAYFSAGEKRKKLKIKKFTKRNGRKTVKNREFSVRGCYFCRKYDIIFRIIPMQRRGTTMDVRVGDVLEMKKKPSLRQPGISGAAVRHGFSSALRRLRT
jgi:hypothetical protein